MDPLQIRRTRPAETNTRSPLRETASQTAGPYVHIGCLPNMVGIEGVYPEDLTCNKPLESDVLTTVTGQVFEGDGIVSKDMMLEFWQADQTGDYSNGIWHRAGTNLETGFFTIETVMPGFGRNSNGVQLAPFISVWVTARGINLGLFTRIYFPEHHTEIANDPHLNLVDASRRETLMAKKVADDYRFDIHLQGAAETVFFEV